MNHLHPSVPKSVGSEHGLLDIFELRQIICASTQTQCVRSFSTSLRAIVVTGSLARDEASFLREGSVWICSGDAEFLVVLDPSVTDPSATELSSFQKSIENDLALKGIVCSISLAPVRPDYFRKLPPHIFSYELRHCGAVLSGDDRILETIPDFSVNELSQEDAWRLLCNRLIEQLICIHDFTEGRPGRRLEYATIKLYLDMATSYLVFAGAYEPTYRGRARRLRELTERSSNGSGVPFSMMEFADRVAECTEWKLSGGRRAAGILPAYWQQSIYHAQQLWRWETIRMSGGAAGHSTAALWDQMTGKLRLSEKIRGWAATARRAGLRGAPNWRRWAGLVLRTTPRYMIYRVGTELTFSLPSLVGGDELPPSGQDWARMASLLPVSEQMTEGSEKSWEYLARQILTNYRDFVACTRA